jgi:G3E family GTPase
MAAVIFALAWPGANHVGIWTFVVLWWMHQSAKLNVFLGVPNLNEQFVPDHLQFLRSFLNQKPMNLLFPVSVSISTVIAFLVLQQGFTAPAGGFEATGLIFLGTLMTLATLEHWFLVLPLPTQNLWQWSMASRQVRRPFDAEIVVGFLGAGKTSHVRRLLAAADPAVRTLVLVNDFGAIGIDGSLLSGRGAEIVELSNGCICCSLTADLATQLQAAIARWAPQRVVIEPSGVADVAALLRVLDQPSLRPLVRRLSVSTVIDAGSFLCDFARLNRHIQAQAAVAPLLIVNKVDLVGPDELAVVEATLRELNPTARIVRARHGLVEERVAGTELPAAISRVAETRPSPAGEPVGGWHAWSSLLGGVCGLQGLQALLDGVVEGAFGQVERVKGIARAGSGWVHFDIAGGRTSVAAFAPGDGEQPRVMAIGRSLDRAGLQAAFEACAGEAR